jgi:hypothetical protein
MFIKADSQHYILHQNIEKKNIIDDIHLYRLHQSSENKDIVVNKHL